MKIIDPTYKILEAPNMPTDKSVGKFIESIGRLCYKSEGSITDDSYIGFIQRLWRNGHTAMLEHYIFILEVNGVIYEDLVSPKWYDAKFCEVSNMMRYIRITSDNPIGIPHYTVSGSLTAFFKILKALNDSKYWGASGIASICKYLTQTFPNITKWDDSTSVYDKFNPLNRVTPIETGTILTIPKKAVQYAAPAINLTHDWYSVQFTVDRGITHEIVRHRDASFAQESTRYCNYSKDKFSNEITFIKPVGADESFYNGWADSCNDDEARYIKMTTEDKVSPQIARSVLPNSLKADLVMTARVGEWNHFFKLRAAKDAHPQIQLVARNLMNELVDAGNDLVIPNPNL